MSTLLILIERQEHVAHGYRVVTAEDSRGSREHVLACQSVLAGIHLQLLARQERRQVSIGWQRADDGEEEQQGYGERPH